MGKLLIYLLQGLQSCIGLRVDTDPYNMALSSRRAKEAVEYIVSKGISPDRMKAKGYGETKLINKCSNGVKCSKEEHQANRRTEVKILAM